jgi:hypothetical protein
VPGPLPKTCAACGGAIAPHALYYRFVLTLQAEQDVLGGASGASAGTDEELSALLQRLEAGPESAQDLEEQVHWERGGTVCAACRAVVVRVLSPPASVKPH